jgi:hypothetical protein
MTNLDRNLRTLTVCFLIAIFALVPLRFVEVGQNGILEKEEVLGATQENAVVLPKTANMSCFSADEVKSKVNSLAEIMKQDDLDNRVMEELQRQIDEVVDNQCQ